MSGSRAVRTNTPQIPLQDVLVQAGGYISQLWGDFIRGLNERVLPLGVEQSFDMTPGLATPADVVGLSFEFLKDQFAVVNVVFQRVTTESTPGANNGQELIEPATFYVWYLPRTKEYRISKLSIPGVTNANVAITITTTGQVQYKGTAMTGIKDVDKITWRAETLKAKLAKAQGVWT